jgi:hypothetical protein
LIDKMLSQEELEKELLPTGKNLKIVNRVFLESPSVNTPIPSPVFTTMNLYTATSLNI